MAEEPRRPFIRYSFFQVDPQWRRLPHDDRRRAREQLAAIINDLSAGNDLSEGMETRSYSLIGTRADADFLLWQIAPSLEALRRLAAGIRASEMGAYLRTAYSYLSVTRPSPYAPGGHPNRRPRAGAITPRGDAYLFVYPFTKTHGWYQLSKEQRQEMMNEHFKIGHRFPGVQVHTTYSFGIDDHDFALAFESNDPEEFVRLVMELRESEARAYTLVDTPIFTCLRADLAECLAEM